MSNEKVARFNKQHFVVGLKQTLKALKKDQVASLIIAKDVEIYLLAAYLAKSIIKAYRLLISKANRL